MPDDTHYQDISATMNSNPSSDNQQSLQHFDQHSQDNKYNNNNHTSNYYNNYNKYNTNDKHRENYTNNSGHSTNYHRNRNDRYRENKSDYSADKNYTNSINYNNAADKNSDNNEYDPSNPSTDYGDTNNNTNTNYHNNPTNSDNPGYSYHRYNRNYSNYSNYNPSTQPTGYSDTIASNNTGSDNLSARQDTTNLNASASLSDHSVLDPHFWDDCEYIKYEKDSDSCSMCNEEVEDDDELRKHLTTQHQVVFFACTKCKTIYPDQDHFNSHECKPNPPPPPPPSPPREPSISELDKKRKRGFNKNIPPPAPPPKKPPKVIPEKVKLNELGAVYVPPHKRLHRHKPAIGASHMQDLLQWQQSYAVPQPQPAQTQGEVEEGEEIGDSETKVVTLSRDLLLQAKAAPDGLPVDVERMPDSAILCTTCGLLFASSYQLQRHAGFSKVHKKNVDKQRREEQKAVRLALTGDTKRTAVTINDANTYRDRSAERRAENPEGCVLDYQPYDAVTDYIAPDAPIESNNVGRKLLESMGWKEGKGLGKNEVGIVAPILPQKTLKGAGLGAEVNNYDIAATEASTYADYTRNKKFARYAQMAKMIKDPVAEK